MSRRHEVEAAFSEGAVGAMTRRVLDLVGGVAGEIITITSVDGVTRYASPSTFATLGWQPDELCDNLLDLIHDDDRPIAVEAWQQLVVAPGATATLEVRVRTRDDRWLWLRSTGRNATDDAAVAGIVWNHRDVTDEVLARSQLNQGDERFRRVLEHGYDAFVLIDHHQRVEWVSDRTSALLGFTEQQLQGQPVLDYVHPDDHHAAAEALLGFLQSRPTEPVVLRVRDAGGEWLFLDVVGADLRLNPTVGGFLLCLRDVTQRHRAEQELRRNEERFRALLRNAADVIVVFDERAKVTYVSPESELFGREIDQVLGHDALEWVHPEDLAELADDLAHVLVTEGAHARRTFRILDGHGVWRWVDAAVTNMTDNPAVAGVVANIRDVTARVEAERNAQRLLQIFDATDDQVGITAPDGTLLHVNGAARRHLGLEPDTLLKVELLDFFPAWELDRIRHEVLPALNTSGTWTGELDIDAPVRGGTLPVAAQFLAHRDAQGRVEHYSAVLRDISERKAFEDQLEHEATHDPLTGLPNRTLLIDRLTMAVNRAQRHGTDVAVLFLDLDHFKVVNDSHGHSLGDALLRGIAERIATTVRPDDTVARFGGDEFVVVCEDLRNDTQALRVAQRILDSLEAVFGVDGTDIFVGASIGLSSFRRSSDDTVTPETLLREADAAMYRAKERGRNQIALFDETLRSRSLLRLDTETALRRALERDELLLHFQPVVDLGSGRVRDLEALVRWAHPDRGLLGPGEFIGIAEETGLIVPLGAWVLDTACRTLAAWRAGSDELHHVGVSVNLSGRQMADDDLVPGLRRILERTGLPPDRLTLEITESLLMDDVEFSHRTLAELRALRVRLAVDDFGTGYSSLSYLRTFPVDVLKVDQSFVADLGTDDGDEAIVAAIVRLAHTLGLEAVAEGVETPAQLARLQALGCDLAQGFHLARPAPAPDTAPLLRRILVT